MEDGVGRDVSWRWRTGRTARLGLRSLVLRLLFAERKLRSGNETSAFAPHTYVRIWRSQVQKRVLNVAHG